ncbi:hypothetical protein QBC46DRAFT_36606 [Diplogelasinospora grovesii]|uniref:Uncharacterized protein n=1 Tax=Diplogelasinospora grovesii TaxID=303347 RepID=A0AAN6N0V4_9PEZI|nr:hypothetical protein QBC46DRAFT_36606 [Diplogelasinospora grovesii]
MAPHKLPFLEEEKTLPTARDSKQRQSTLPQDQQRRTPTEKKKMACARRTLLAVSLCLLVLLGLASAARSPKATPCHEGNKVPVPEQKAVVESEPSSFSALLNAASPEVLHDLLHKYFPERFQHGVWSSEHQALDAVHRDNPPLATSLARLARRQDGNSNSTTSAAPTTSPNSPTSSSNSPTTPSTSATNSPTSAASTTANPQTTPSSATPSTSNTPNTSSATSDNNTPTSRSSKLVTQTFTSTSNGAVVIVTATTMVGANPTDASGSATTKAPGSLQTGAASGQRNSGGMALGGVLMGAAVAMLV